MRDIALRLRRHAVNNVFYHIVIFLYSRHNYSSSFNLRPENSSRQIFTNIWLSDWSNDNPYNANGTYDRELADYRLGVYGGLGAAQGTTQNNDIKLSILTKLFVTKLFTKDPANKYGKSLSVFLTVLAHFF